MEENKMKKKSIIIVIIIILLLCVIGGAIWFINSNKETEDVANTDVVPTAVPTEAPAPEPTEVPTPEPTEVPTPEPDNFIESRENDEYRYAVYERHVKITKYIGMKPEVTIPDTIDGLPVTVIGFKAFFRYYCHDDRDPRHQLGLEKLVVSDSVEIIEDYALAGLEECDSITFGKGLKVIGNNAVQNGFALRELKFTGNSLEKVGAWAFANCISIEKIELPASVKTVGAGAFLCCRSSEKLEFGEETTVGKGVQFGCTPVKNCTNIDKWLGKR
jgi:hypothetical protein